MKKLEVLKKSIIAWIWFSLTIVVVSLAYATISNVNTWDTLTAEKWNEIVDELTPVAAHYSVNTTESFSQWVVKTVNFWNKEYDSHNAVTTWAWWNFLVPKDWLYRITSNVSAGSYDWNQNESMWLWVNKNWVNIKLLNGGFVSDTSVSTSWNISGSTTIKALENDTLSIYLTIWRWGSGDISNLNPGSVNNWVAIERIGALPQ